MATTNKIENVCHAIQKTDITLEAPNGGFVNGKNIRFKDACNQLFSEASRIPLSDEFEMINPNHVKILAQFSTQTGIKIRIRRDASRFSARANPDGNKIEFAPIVDSGAKGIKRALFHEYGHIRDNVVIKKNASARFALPKEASLEQRREALFQLLILMRHELTPKEQARFDAFNTKIIGDIENLNGSNIFALFDTIDEVFRYGEEINTATFRSYAMSDHFPFYKKPTPNFVGERYDPFITPENKRIDLKLSFARARLEEAGLWEEFQAKLSTSDKYDPSSVGKEDPEVVEFLRLALRGSGKYPRAPQEWKP